MSSRMTMVSVICAASLLTWGGGLCAEESAAAPVPALPQSGLGVRQQHVQRLMQQLEEKLISLTQSLSEKDPQRAARLHKTLLEAKQLSLEQRMASIARLLDDASLDKATDEQKRVVKDLERLAEVLLGEDRRDATMAEIDRLERWRNQVQSLIEQQRQHVSESGKLADKDKAAAELGKQIAAVEKLIDSQKQVIADNQKARSDGINGLGPVAGQQKQVREATQELADKIEGPPESEDGGKQDGGKQDGQQSKQAPNSQQPGVAPLNDSIKHQKNAEKNLDKGRGKAGESDQKQALAKLEAALGELKREQSRIATLPPEAEDRQAEKQGDTAEKTGKVGDEIAQAAQQSGQQGGQQGGEQGSQSGGKPPAQQPIQNAQKQMQQAAKRLSDHKPAQAVPPADEALKDLKKALKEIEDRLAQLREEERLEKLAGLEARFQEMLVRQPAATASTAEVDKRRAGSETLRRADAILLGKVATEEQALTEMASLALEIIRADGTSVVFPRVVQRMHGDLERVSKWLSNRDTGRLTQSTQIEIERTLEELIAALKEAQKTPKSGKPKSGKPGQPQESEDPLMPDNAELKLLRAAQERVNRLTQEFDKQWQTKPLDDPAREEIRRISQRQQDIAIMTEEMIKRK